MTNEIGRPAKNSYQIDVSTVHDALAESRFKARPGAKLNLTIRTDPKIKELAHKICATQGTNISDYLRCCLDALVRDYTGPKAFEELQKTPDAV